jgi:small-conductance mechanosensitive channel
MLLNRLAAKGLSQDVIHLLKRLYLILIIALLTFSVLELLNVPLTAFAFVSGAIAIGVGFGAQNILNNFISGWILMWERPIRIGDFVELDNARGVVQSINTRSTCIRRVDGVHLLVPNSHLLENIVVNWTLIDQLARSTVSVGVAYGSPVEQVINIIENIANAEPNVLHDPAPMVIFEEFGDSALIFDLYFWGEATGERDLRVIRSDLRRKIDSAFREHNISIAFPQRDLHMKTAAPIEVRVINPE